MENDFQMEVVDITNEGYGVCKYEKMVYFVENAIYKEVLTVKDCKKKGNIVYCKKDKTIKESPVLVKSTEIINSKNPSALLKDIEYNEQLRIKINKVKNTIKKIAKIDNFEIDSIKRADSNKFEDVYLYRNKSRFKVQNGKVGYFIPKTNTLCEINRCILSSSSINNCLYIIKEKLSKNILQNFNEITIKSNDKNEVMLEFEFLNTLNKEKVSSNDNYDELFKNIIIKLEEDEFVKKFLHTIIFKNGNKVLYEQSRKEAEFTRNIGSYRFYVSHDSFFQVNERMNEVLYREIENKVEIVKEKKEFVNKGNDLKLLELYSGVGSIGIFLEKHFKKVTGVEVVENATKNSKYNVKLNNLDKNKFEYITLKSEEIDESYLKSADIVLVDPPRAGLESSLIKTINNSNVKYLIYVSCDVATLARDIKRLREVGYKLSSFSLVDMFPNTMHVENVVLIEKLN